MRRVLMLLPIVAVSIASYAQDGKSNVPAAYDNVQKEQLIKQQMRPAMSYDQFVLIKDADVKTLKENPVLSLKDEAVRFRSATSLYQQPLQDWRTPVTFKPGRIIY